MTGSYALVCTGNVVAFCYQIDMRVVIDTNIFLSVCEWTRVYYIRRPNLPDEADNHLIELAVADGTDLIVTRNLRDVRRGELHFPHLRMISPEDFLKEI